MVLEYLEPLKEPPNFLIEDVSDESFYCLDFINDLVVMLCGTIFMGLSSGERFYLIFGEAKSSSTSSMSSSSYC